MFSPTIYDMGVYLYSFGLFFTLFFLFTRFFPVINMAEMKSILKTDSDTKI